jgi:hypothetical protein
MDTATWSASVLPPSAPAKMTTKVMPICTDNKKWFGVLASSKAVFAFVLPLFAHSWSRDLRAVTTAISDIVKTPLAKMSSAIMSTSIPIPDILTNSSPSSIGRKNELQSYQQKPEML